MKTGKTERKLTIKDIAEQAGVSITTASFVLNGQDEKYGIKTETAERVREVVRKNKFRPNYGARILKTGKSHTMAFIAPSITDGFYNEVVVSIETTALQAGYQLILCNSLDQVKTEQTYLKNLIERKVDGIVLVPVDPSAEHLNLLKQENIKTVLFCPPELATPGFYTVDFDLAAAPELAVDHLVEQGCRNIVLLDWRPTKPRASSWARNRSVLRKTFQESLRRHKLPGGTDAVWTLFGEETNPADAETFKQLLNEQKPDAIIAMRDIQLLRAWHPLTEAGFSVPGDIRLAGCDDIPASLYWSPPITSITMPKIALGKHVVDVLLNDQIQTGTRTFPVELIVRASSNRPL
jgi:LacI family transcriptional regulator, purine nucleotide synthesis repressor